MQQRSRCLQCTSEEDKIILTLLWEKKLQNKWFPAVKIRVRGTRAQRETIKLDDRLLRKEAQVAFKTFCCYLLFFLTGPLDSKPMHLFHILCSELTAQSELTMRCNGTYTDGLFHCYYYVESLISRCSVWKRWCYNNAFYMIWLFRHLKLFFATASGAVWGSVSSHDRVMF